MPSSETLTEPRSVWVVTKKGVYDHGVHYVALSEVDAKAFCARYRPDNDGYHSWRIDMIAVGAVDVDAVFEVPS